MPDASLWSTNPADNDDADPDIPLPEGMAPGLVNNDIRAVMAAVAKLRSGDTSLGTPVVSNPTVATGVLNRQTADARYGNSAFVDVASATTTDLGAATSANVRITGGVTINSLGNAPAGTVRECVVATGFILTHNNTSLILPTRANIVCAGGDTFRAVSLGSSNWMVTRYTVAAAPMITSVSLGSSGYLRLSNGLMKQWGRATTVGGQVTITYPLAMTTVARLTATPIGSSIANNEAYAVSTDTVGITQATIVARFINNSGVSAAAINVDWELIGY